MSFTIKDSRQSRSSDTHNSVVYVEGLDNLKQPQEIEAEHSRTTELLTGRCVADTTYSCNLTQIKVAFADCDFALATRTRWPRCSAENAG